MEYVLTLSFLTAGGKSVSLNIPDVKTDISKEEIDKLMTLIIEKDIFASPSGSLIGKNDARLVAKQVTKFDVDN